MTECAAYPLPMDVRRSNVITVFFMAAFLSERELNM
jgi:hypothetical protein